jgi:hypothetical protein
VQYVDYLSQILTHNALFVKDCLLDLTNRLKGAQNNLKIFDFWFDCGNHFRNYELLNFLLRELKPIINATSITVNFFCEHHGKSPVDSHFSLVSREYALAKKQVSVNTLSDLKNLLIQRKSHLKCDTEVVEYMRDDSDSRIKKEITLKTVNNELVRICDHHYYCVCADNSIVVSRLSTSTPLKQCTFKTKEVTDTRKTKFPPKRSEPTVQPTVLGPHQKVKLQRHARELSKSSGVITNISDNATLSENTTPVIAPPPTKGSWAWLMASLTCLKNKNGQ